jgi:hypothetical protein
LLLLVDVVAEPEDDEVEELVELLPDDVLSLLDSVFAAQLVDEPPVEDPDDPEGDDEPEDEEDDEVVLELDDELSLLPPPDDESLPDDDPDSLPDEDDEVADFFEAESRLSVR